MKYFIFSLIVLAICSSQNDAQAQQKSIYDFTVEALDGGEINFEKFKGKKILIVNTASKCGLTPQYKGLEQLHQKYGKNLVIVGFPANNFARQEPGSDKEIASFCQKNFGVSFLMASKISVKGDDQHPLYAWLTQKQQNGFKDSKVKWNFQKYLLDEKGKLISVISPRIKPMSEKIIEML
jgi:glutathione peroxidase